MPIDVRALKAKYATYPNILRFIDASLKHGVYPMLERIQAAGPIELTRIGMSLEELDELFGYMLPKPKNNE